jgi:imidazolonepropionase-like amidohydrolase
MANIPDVVALRRQVAAGHVPGPTIFTTGRILDGAPAIFPAVSTEIGDSEAAVRAVAAEHQAGVDFIKVYNNLRSDALRETVRTAHAKGLAVIGHIPRRDGRDQALQTALAAGIDLIAHGEEYFFTFFYGGVDSALDLGRIPHPDTSSIAAAVEMTRSAGTAVVPNLAFIAMTRAQLDDLARVLADSESRYLPPVVADLWRRQNPTRRPDLERFDRRERAKYPLVQRLTRALEQAGVPLLLGTDASAPGVYPGRSAHVELAELVRAGLTPYQALATGTRNPARFVSRHVPGAVPFGIVTRGARADLVLLRGNPLADIANARLIEGVVVRGRWLSAADLERLRTAAAPGN